MRKLLVLAAFAVFGVIALAARPGGDTPVVHAATPIVFNFTGAEVPWQVPAGVTSVLIEARGGRGGNAQVVTGIASCAVPAVGGIGYQVTTRLAVTPGQFLYVNVGGNGTVTAGGFNGGGNGGVGVVLATEGGAGGGGASDVRLAPAAPATRVVTAGGGGGAGGCGNFTGTLGGNGGNSGFPAASPGADGLPVFGGGGGGLGAVGAIPGAAGISAGSAPTPGTALGVGGNGGVGLAQTFQGGSGGGGGGGCAGGGGAGAGSAAIGGGGGGGGGGSSCVGTGTSGTVAVLHPDGQASVGRVTITPIDALTITKAFAPRTVQVNTPSVMTITVTNGNPFPLTNVAFTDTLPAGLTIDTAVTATGTPYCGTIGTVTVTSTSVSLAGGNMAASTSCQIVLSVRSATPGTYPNTILQVTSTEAPPGGPATDTLTVTALPNTPVPNTPVPPSPIPSVIVPPPPPIIPQVFQHVPQGIFNGSRNNTPTPVVRAAVASVIDPGVMPVLRPPSTGDAGLKAERGSGFVPLIALAGVLSFSAGAVWRLRAR